MATGARALIRGLLAEGAAVRLEPKVLAGQVACEPDELTALLSLATHEGGGAVIHRCPVHLIDPYAPGRVRVAMTALPPENVSAGLAQRLSLMDAVWVPSERNVDAFVAAGVDRALLHVVPEPVDLDRLLATPSSLDLPDAHGTVFVAPFEWGRNTAWHALLDAWCRALTAEDDATLVLAVWSPQERSDEEIQSEILQHLSEVGHDPARMADVVILSRQITEDEMPALYAAADVVCAPGRTFGAGRIAIEALAAGRPVIAPTWHGDHLIDEAVGWPATGPEQMAVAIRDAFDNPHKVAARAAAGPSRVDRHDHRAVARIAVQALAATVPRLAPKSARPSLVIEGAISGPSSLAGINRALARALASDDRIDIGVVDIGERASTDELGPALSESVGGLLSAYPDVTIHHAHPPEFLSRTPGRSVQVAHWEYGPPPADWAELVRTRTDEVWASSHWVRDWYLRCGMDPERVTVVPLGIDPREFNPQVTPMDLGDRAPGYRFLFIGGLVWRKGADLLATAFGDAFTANDDVTLVIKTYGAAGPYNSDGCDLLIERLRELPGGPRVHLLTQDMADSEMPGLYAACDCLVHPYRGEAFGMTMLEAMACGLPVVMPDKGAARDFADESTALLVPSRTHTIPSLEATGLRMTEYPVVVEMEPDALAERLRWVVENRDAARAVGQAAARHVAQGWTWQHVVQHVVERTEALAGGKVPAWT